MSNHKGFPITNGKIIVDFSNQQEIIKSLNFNISNNKLDAFTDSVLTILIKIINKELIGEKFILELTQEDLSYINNKSIDDQNISVNLNIIDNTLSGYKEVKVKNYSKDPNKCFSLIENYDIDLQRRGKCRTITIYDKEKKYSASANSLEAAIIGAYISMYQE